MANAPFACGARVLRPDCKPLADVDSSGRRSRGPPCPRRWPAGDRQRLCHRRAARLSDLQRLGRPGLGVARAAPPSPHGHAEAEGPRPVVRSPSPGEGVARDPALKRYPASSDPTPGMALRRSSARRRPASPRTAPPVLPTSASTMSAVVLLGLLLIGIGSVVLLLDWNGLSRRMPTQVPPRALAAVPLVVGSVLVAAGLIM